MPQDVLIIGAGPAGLAAGIALRQAGARVKILERAPQPADGPGETFHPGIEAIFDELGVGDALRTKSLCRHAGIMIDHAGVRTFQYYGQDWRGFQIRKHHLTQVLCDRYLALSGELVLASPAAGYHRTDGIHQMRTATTDIRAPWLIDATGGVGWLDRQLAIPMIDHSPKIWLHYGYNDTNPEATHPILNVQPDHWRWQAPLGDGQTAWVEGHTTRIRNKRPGAKIMDGTWKTSAQPAGDHFFRIGDAACRLDPRNGHGVLRALMSGIMTAHLIRGVEDGKLPPEVAADSFNRWLQTWFEYDAGQLRQLQTAPLHRSKTIA